MKYSPSSLFVVCSLSGNTTTLASEDVFTERTEAEGLREELDNESKKYFLGMSLEHHVLSLDHYILAVREDARNEGQYDRR